VFIYLAFLPKFRVCKCYLFHCLMFPRRAVSRPFVVRTSVLSSSTFCFYSATELILICASKLMYQHVHVTYTSLPFKSIILFIFNIFVCHKNSSVEATSQVKCLLTVRYFVEVISIDLDLSVQTNQCEFGIHSGLLNLTSEYVKFYLYLLLILFS